MSYPERDIQRAPHRGHSVYTADPFPDHLPTHSAHEEHHHRRRIPTLPDLRFEYSYLRGVRSYVRVERLESTHTNEKGKGVALPEETGSEGTQQSTRREVLHVQWGNIVWATLRDQVISPFLQGALWGIASLFILPTRSLLLGTIRSWWTRSRFHPNIEGGGVAQLRSWVGGLYSSNVRPGLAR